MKLGKPNRQNLFELGTNALIRRTSIGGFGYQDVVIIDQPAGDRRIDKIIDFHADGRLPIDVYILRIFQVIGEKQQVGADR